MWKHYRKTFVRMQVMIAVITCLVFFIAGRQLPPAMLFFVVMQVCAVFGAIWAARLATLFGGRAQRLPLHRT